MHRAVESMSGVVRGKRAREAYRKNEEALLDNMQAKTVQMVSIWIACSDSANEDCQITE
jgi:hypothetical protein